MVSEANQSRRIYSMKKAILFDIDGTLLDTSQFIFKAYQYSLLTNCKKQITLDDLTPLMGKSLAYCYQELVPNGDIEALCRSHHDFQLQNLHLAIPFPNTAKILRKLKQNNFKIGTVSNRASNTTKKTLQLANLAKYIDVVISVDDVKKPKPDKEPIDKALKILGIKANQALFVGDTETDILTGKNAKVTTIGVTYGWLGKKIASHKPDYLIDNIGELLTIVLKLRHA